MRRYLSFAKQPNYIAGYGMCREIIGWTDKEMKGGHGPTKFNSYKAVLLVNHN